MLVGPMRPFAHLIVGDRTDDLFGRLLHAAVGSGRWETMSIRFTSFGLRAGASMLALACGDEDMTYMIPPEVNVEAEGPTFGQHVSPIFNDKCVRCHQEGGIGPFRLDDYQTAKSWSNRIAAATEARIMPPYLMETGGECGSFDESTALSAEQIATIAEWVRAGAPEGTQTQLALPALPTLTEAREWTTPLYAPVIQGGVLAAFDEYRCFRIELGLDADTWTTGVEVLPGNPQIVHHVVGFLVDPDAPALAGTNTEMMAALHQADPTREGWPCFGNAGEGIAVESVPVSWGPGTGAYSFPGGTGVRVRKNRELVVQVHYNMATPGSEGQEDQTVVKLRLADAVERQAIFLLPDPLLESLSSDPVTLPPGRELVPFTWVRSLETMLGGPALEGIELMSSGAHMHERGRKWTLELDSGSGFECIGRVNRWDFGWQRKYDYAVRPVLPPGAQFRTTCEYDTSGDTEAVLPGWGTRNEMCLSVMMVAFPPGVFF
jgi:hypothetical protein